MFLDKYLSFLYFCIKIIIIEQKHFKKYDESEEKSQLLIELMSITDNMLEIIFKDENPVDRLLKALNSHHNPPIPSKTLRF